MADKLPSEVCHETNVQNCHACDDLECGDNLGAQQSAAKCDTPQQSEVKLDDNRPFPIQGGFCDRPKLYYDPCTIPWWLAEIAYVYYHERYTNDQTLEVLAKRGGFGREELIAFLRGRSPSDKVSSPSADAAGGPRGPETPG